MEKDAIVASLDAAEATRRVVDTVETIRIFIPKLYLRVQVISFKISRCILYYICVL